MQNIIYRYQYLDLIIYRVYPTLIEPPNKNPNYKLTQQIQTATSV